MTCMSLVSEGSGVTRCLHSIHEDLRKEFKKFSFFWGSIIIVEDVSCYSEKSLSVCSAVPVVREKMYDCCN